MRGLAILMMLVLGGVAFAQAPSLRIFGEKAFQPGAYKVTALRGAPTVRDRCLAGDGDLLFGGRKLASRCRIIVLSDADDAAAIGWNCPNGDSGRTDIRRDHETAFTVSSQGVAGSLPFSSRASFERTGECEAGKIAQAKE